MFEGFTTTRIVANGVSIHLEYGGSGPPVLLMHGNPQTHVEWHKVAPELAKHYTVVVPDMRGYGDSEKPPDPDEDMNVYSFRTMAQDQLEVMANLGFASFHFVGHDRGVRVGHRMALDHPEAVRSLTSLDVVPSQAAWDNMDSQLAFSWFHWLLARQPAPFPETLIGNSAKFFLDFLLERWSATEGAITEEAYAEYLRAYDNPDNIKAWIKDYRAIELDLIHDEEDRGRKLTCPVLVLWGADRRKRPGWQTGRGLDDMTPWQERAVDVRGKGLDCGHFIPEERPEELLAELKPFLADSEAKSQA